MRGSGRCAGSSLNRRIEPDASRSDPIRYWHIGFDSADTLKGVGRCIAKGIVQSRFAAQQAAPFLPPVFSFFQEKTLDLHASPQVEASYVSLHPFGGGFEGIQALFFKVFWSFYRGLKMAPKRGSDDIRWQHGVMLENRHNFKCNYCGFTGQGGGVSRLKKHLAGDRLAGYHDVQGCKMVPREVKKLMIEHLKHVRAETARKRADKRIISGRE
ncbi:hypothetical protein Taro_038459 [Colocasia esculenta]|uniref:BED-type domain-containing protein n=1 Tax=Colocasia esculenta TaxID=4460 RepID=A0A843WJB1_COLES|nr:hypothetical protein [Colocasia esculenta]